MPNPFHGLNPLDYLRIGLSGFLFLLIFLAFRLIEKEQQREGKPRSGIKEMVYVFMVVALLSSVIVGIAGYFQPHNLKEENAALTTRISDLSGQITKLNEQNQHYLNVTSENARLTNEITRLHEQLGPQADENLKLTQENLSLSVTNLKYSILLSRLADAVNEKVVYESQMETRMNVEVIRPALTNLVEKIQEARNEGLIDRQH